MSHTNTHKPTLFARYKSMINNFYAAGKQEYTSKELNAFVGQYEHSTWYKRINNNPHYTTRTYQTALKQLGCITPIKRGLWKINAPIPQWFSSLHLNALLYSASKAELEKSSDVWRGLPADHKVNPWATANSAPISKTMEYHTVESCISSIFTKEDVLKLLSDQAKGLHDIFAAQEKAAPLPVSTDGSFTKDDVMQVLKDFAERLTADVTAALENAASSLDEDIVSLDMNYNRQIEVEVEHNTIADEMTSAASIAIDDFLQEYEITIPRK